MDSSVVSNEEEPTSGGVDTVIVARSTDEIREALELLTELGGGEIRVAARDMPYTLKGGNYGSENGTIRIVADDPTDPPVFSIVSVFNSKNLTIDGVIVDSSSLGLESNFSYDFRLNGCSDIVVENCAFSSIADGFYSGVGSAARGKSLGTVFSTTDFVFRDNVVTGYSNSLELRDVTDGVVEGNEFSKFQGDGLRLMGVVDTIVKGNSFTEPYGSTQDINHSDMIQVMSGPTGTQNTEGLQIIGNYFNSGDGAASQTIFIKSERFFAGGEAFKDIVVSDNLIYNGHQHGIALYGVQSAYVGYNTLLWNETSGMQATANSAIQNMVPLIEFFDVTDGLMQKNIAGGFVTSADTTLDGNRTINFSDPDSPDYVGLRFVNAVGGGARSEADLQLRPDTELYGLAGVQIKSAVAEDSPFSEELAPIVVTKEARADFSGLVYTYQANNIWLNGKNIDPSAALLTWTFSDQTQLTGEMVTHGYQQSGDHGVILEVFTADGDFSTFSTTVVRDRTPLDYNPDIQLQAGEFWAAGEVVKLVDDAVANQDVSGSAEIIAPTAITLTGNTWKGVDVDVSLTKHSVLHFDFSSDIKGEIHAIGFTNGDALTPEAFFQIDGTQTYGVQAANGHYTSGGEIQGYDISVGQYVTGDFDRIVFVSDDDAHDKASATFANVSIEEIRPKPFYDADVVLEEDEFWVDGEVMQLKDEGVAWQDLAGGATIDGPTEVTLTGNTWKGLDVSVTLTEDSVLCFDFSSDVEGEIHAIGFTNGDALNPAALFELDGTQTYGIQAANDQYTTGSGLRSYEIAVGEYVTGDFDRIVLVSDDDAHARSVSTFANIDII